MKNARRANTLHDVRISILTARGNTTEGVVRACKELSDQTNQIRIYHPMVVMDAPLWLLEGTQLSPVQWCRLHWGTGGYVAEWADVVRREAFNGYVESLSQHYDAAMRRVRARGLLRRSRSN